MAKSKIWKKSQEWMRSQGWGGNVKKYATSNMNSMNDYRNFKRAVRAAHRPAPAPAAAPPTIPTPTPTPTISEPPPAPAAAATQAWAPSAYNPPNWSSIIPEPPPPPPKMTSMGIADVGAGSTALGVKTATGPGADLNIGSTGDVFGRKKKKTATTNLLPTSGLTA